MRVAWDANRYARNVDGAPSCRSRDPDAFTASWPAREPHSPGQRETIAFRYDAVIVRGPSDPVLRARRELGTDDADELIREAR